ncbi:MAG: PEP-CTERM sorting domain-containing protein [Acidobacteriia bacterium]|nr:PEP-CTERM sorting domain-containing protein [Terriglobia bacterium]
MRALSTTLLLGLCIGLAPSLHASVSFATGNGTVNGSSIVFNGGTFTATATAFSTTGNSNTTLATATLGQYTYGLGVCNSNENAGGCTTSGPPEHAVSNQTDTGVFPNVQNFDFVLLQFSVPLSSIQLTLSPFGTTEDMDATYFTGNCTGTCTATNFRTNIIGKTDTTSVSTGLAAITGVSGVSTGSFTSPTTNISQSFTLNNAGPVNWVLIGASTAANYGGNGVADYFKLYSMDGSTGVPEPATFGMAGAALAALGLLRRRKRLSANS